MELRIRDVPENLHHRLKAEAAMKGISLNVHVIEILRLRDLIWWAKKHHPDFAGAGKEAEKK